MDRKKDMTAYINKLNKILFIFLLFFSTVYPQINKDSLYKALISKSDEVKYKTLSDLCWLNRYNDSKSALEFGEKALVIAKKTGNKNSVAQILNRIGVIYKWINNLDTAMKYAQDALIEAQEAKDSVEIGYAENNIGGVYQFKMFNALAIEHMLKAQKIFEKINYLPGIAACLVNIGTIYEHNRNYERALEYFNRALKYRTDSSEKLGIASSLNGIASVYLAEGLFDPAYDKLREVESLAAELKDKFLLVTVYEGYARIAIERKQYNKAEDFFNKSLELTKNMNNERAVLASSINLINLHIQKGDYTNVEKELEAVYKMIKKGKNEPHLADYYLAYSKYYDKKGDYKKALYYGRLYGETKDAIVTRENIARGDELQSVKRYLDTINQNELLKKTIEFDKAKSIRMAIIYVLTVVLLLVIYWRYRLKKNANKKLSELNAMKDMFFGIIAHDLKNPFQTILSASEMLLTEMENLSKEEIKEVIQLIENSGRQTFKLLENLLYWSLSQTGGINYSPETVSLLEVVNETIALHSNSANSKHITLGAKIPEDLIAFCDKEMIKLVLRNLVSNGIKYTKEGGTVEITLKKSAAFVEVSVKDNGVGMTPERKSDLVKIGKHASTPGTHGEKGTGLGLLLCREFVEKNNGKFSIESEAGRGSSFNFTLPAVSC